MNQPTDKRTKVKLARRAHAQQRRSGGVHRIKRRKPAPKVEPLDPTRELPRCLSWYALTVAPNREYSVAHWLEDRGDMTIVPLETRVRLKAKARGGKHHSRDLYQIPLFPRMVLVGFAAPPNWLVTMDHFHITGVLGFNGEPAVMRRGEAERLRESSEALRQAGAGKPLAKGGKAVVVAPGLFCGHVVGIETITKNEKKAMVIQNWFGQERIVEMNVDDLVAA